MKESKPFIFFLSVLVVIFFTACKKPEVKIPVSVISKDSMVLVLVDVHLAEAALAQKNLIGESDGNFAAAYYRHIFNKHNITAERYKESVKFYSAHPMLYEKIYENVISELSRQQAASMGKKKN